MARKKKPNKVPQLVTKIESKESPVCPYCHKPARWVDNIEIYGKRYGKSHMAWWCKGCDAYVGCHQNSKRPLGTLANAELRMMRSHVHSIIDPLWQSGQYSRSTLYLRLANYFEREIHVGQSDLEQCKAILAAMPLLFTQKCQCGRNGDVIHACPYDIGLAVKCNCCETCTLKCQPSQE